MDRTRTSTVQTHLNVRPPVPQHQFKTAQPLQQYSDLHGSDSLVENQIHINPLQIHSYLE